MLVSVNVTNLGPLEHVEWLPGVGLNVVVGPNGSGKTLLLKAMYAAQRAQEEFRRGDDKRTFRQVLEDKLVWTFQVDRLGALVRRGAEAPLAVDIGSADGDGSVQLRFSLTGRAKRGVGQVGDVPAGRDAESIFVPAKEVVSLIPVIKESRSRQKFGFGDPTWDLVQALEREPSRGKPPFGEARKRLESTLDGRITVERGAWVFRAGRETFPVAITAEGHKKIAILDRLIVNRTLSYRSVLFVDEPESFLHPRALLGFLRILATMAEHGLQVFMATHSLFVLNALRVYAKAEQRSVPLLSLSAVGPPIRGDLREEMPPNPLVDASIELYEMEVDGTWYETS